MTIKDNIKRIRTEHNLSQEELSKIAGVSDKTVSSWENGTRTPRMGPLQRIADYFGIKIGDIIEDMDSAGYYADPETAKLAQELHDNPRYKALMNSTRKLSPEAVEEVMKFIDYQLTKEGKK